MEINKNKVMSSLINDLKIEIIDSGYALCDNVWNIKEKTPYSRLYYIAAGEGWIESDEGIITLKAGYGYFVPPEYKLHAWTDLKLDQLYVLMNLIQKNKLDLFYQCHNIIEFPCENMAELIELYKSRAINSAFKMLEYIYRDLATCSLMFNTGKHNNVAYSETALKAIEYIENNLSSHLKIDDIAKEVFVSRSKLIDIFNDELKISVGRYIEKLLLFEIEKELISGNLTIEQIVSKYEFCDRPYFVRFFQKRTGYTPRQYRNKMKRFDIKYI